MEQRRLAVVKLQTQRKRERRGLVGGESEIVLPQLHQLLSQSHLVQGKRWIGSAHEHPTGGGRLCLNRDAEACGGLLGQMQVVDHDGDRLAELVDLI